MRDTYACIGVLQPVLYPQVPGVSANELESFLDRWNEYEEDVYTMGNVPVPMRQFIKKSDLSTICHYLVEETTEPRRVKDDVLEKMDARGNCSQNDAPRCG